MAARLDYRRLNLTGRTCALVAGVQDIGPRPDLPTPFSAALAVGKSLAVETRMRVFARAVRAGDVVYIHGGVFLFKDGRLRAPEEVALPPLLRGVEPLAGFRST